MKLANGVAAICVLGCIASLSAEEQHSHPAPEKLGTVTFPTSCAPGVQKGFERGVALLHSFAYTASEEAFRAVAKADPRCAMAHWGMAMTYFHPLWAPPGAAELAKGSAEIDQAKKLTSGAARERQFIEAAAAYYAGSAIPPVERAQAYEKAMAQTAQANPRDTEAQTFYALALLATAPPADRTHINQKRAAEILEPLYRDQPQHPGLAHYLIHAYDSAELASRGLAAARAYSKIAPSAPHALHMPSHIFTRMGYWDDSIASNQAARAAAHTEGDVGEELHAMDYLTYAYLQRGSNAEAARVIDDMRGMSGLVGGEFKVGYAATAMPVRFAIEQRQWDKAASLQPMPQLAPHVVAIVYWARAMGQARRGHPQEAQSDIAKLNDCVRQLQSSGTAYWLNQTEVLSEAAQAWLLKAQGKSDEAVRRLRSAADKEDAVEKLPVTPGPIVPAREQLGDLLLELKRPQEALREFQAALQEAPGRRGALTGAIQAAELTGDAKTAARLRTDLTRVSRPIA
jgi:tetratricopeptide (TPR) repeat protein